MTVTEQDIVQQLNNLRRTYDILGALYTLNAPIQMFERLIDVAEGYKSNATSMAKNFCQAHKPKDGEPIKRMFKDDTGRLCVKVDLVSDVNEPRLLKVLIEDHKEEFLARASKMCKVIMKEWNSNPIEGIILDDYKDAGYFRGTLTSTPKMYKTIEECVDWALNSVDIKRTTGMKDQLDENMAVLDSIKRECRRLEVLREQSGARY